MVLFLSLLTGCGFHLKGLGQNAVATFSSIKIINDNIINADIKRYLHKQLIGSGVVIATNIVDAEITITFQPTQITSSVTSRTGQGEASSELIKMSQHFTIINVNTEQQILQTTVVSYRDRDINIGALQASARELTSIKKQMSADIATQILTRINKIAQ